MNGADGLDVAYWEVHGRFETGERKPLSGDAVIYSNIDHGAAASPPLPGLCLRFVGRGKENYRIGGRSLEVRPGQVMMAPQDDGAEIDIRKDEAAGTVGLCVLLRGEIAEMPWEFGAVVTSGAASRVGAVLERGAKALWSPARRHQAIAQAIVAELRQEIPGVCNALMEQAASVEAAKASTRYEMVRRAHLAQAYLHAVVDRPVDLDEVARAVGNSAFQLLRSFQHCFGETPAAYHRKLRLNLAMAEATRRRVAIGSVCDEFGFAGASSFSHAYRRAFGHAPVRDRRAA